MVTHIILAPHPDDEVIGCFSILRQPSGRILVVYSGRFDKAREQEIMRLSVEFPLTMNWLDCGSTVLFLDHLRLKGDKIWVYAPDPHWEHHPDHKSISSQVWPYCQAHNVPFCTYSTDMNVPYLRELSGTMQEQKRVMLEKCFPSQKSLWEYDHKYFLFEGISLWNPAALSLSPNSP